MSTRTKVLIAAVLVVAASAYFLWPRGSSTGDWSYSVKTTTSNDTSVSGAAYKVSADVPEFSGPSVQAVNTMFRDRARKTIDDFVTAADQASVDDAANGFEFTEKATIQRIGLIAAVEFAGYTYLGGAHGVASDDWVLIRTDTWTAIRKDQLLLPSAKTDEGATKLAGIIAPKVKGGDPACTTDAATMLAGDQSSKPSGFEDTMAIGLRADAVEFNFPEYLLFAYSCGRGVATVPFSALDGLINPEIVRLATQQS
jgi:hypothetical protein